MRDNPLEGLMTVEGLSALKVADKVEIFKQIAVDEHNVINTDILDSIAASPLQSFLDFCNRVFKEKDSISSISCTIENDQLQYNIEYL